MTESTLLRLRALRTKCANNIITEEEQEELDVLEAGLACKSGKGGRDLSEEYTIEEMASVFD